jgi:hypothetical protein
MPQTVSEDTTKNANFKYLTEYGTSSQSNNISEPSYPFETGNPENFDYSEFYNHSVLNISEEQQWFEDIYSLDDDDELSAVPVDAFTFGNIDVDDNRIVAALGSDIKNQIYDYSTVIDDVEEAPTIVADHLHSESFDDLFLSMNVGDSAFYDAGTSFKYYSGMFRSINGDSRTDATNYAALGKKLSEIAEKSISYLDNEIHSLTADGLLGGQIDETDTLSEFGDTIDGESDEFTNSSFTNSVTEDTSKTHIETLIGDGNIQDLFSSNIDIDRATKDELRLVKSKPKEEYTARLSRKKIKSTRSYKLNEKARLNLTGNIADYENYDVDNDDSWLGGNRYQLVDPLYDPLYLNAADNDTIIAVPDKAENTDHIEVEYSTKKIILQQNKTGRIIHHDALENGPDEYLSDDEEDDEDDDDDDDEGDLSLIDDVDEDDQYDDLEEDIMTDTQEDDFEDEDSITHINDLEDQDDEVTDDEDDEDDDYDLDTSSTVDNQDALAITNYNTDESVEEEVSDIAYSDESDRDAVMYYLSN